MARTPVTKVQLDAYRFGERRLESALVRRDPVLLHEELRGQRRVVVTGVALALLAMVGAFAYAKVSPAPDWHHESVIAGAQSGRYFAVIHDPDRLVPVANLAAARLVLHAADPSGDSGSATARVMDDAQFSTARRTASAAVPGAQATLPGPDAPPVPAGSWAVCGSTDPAGRPLTTLIGAAAPTTPLAASDGLYLAGPDSRYLVAGGTKHLIVGTGPLAAYDLRDRVPRPVGAALLALLPDGPPLRALTVSGAGQPSAALPERTVGDVVRVQTAGVPDRDFLVLPRGVAAVPAPVAELLRAGSHADTGQPPDSVSLERINALERVELPGLAGLPAPTRILDGAPGLAVCWQWDDSGLRPGVTTAATLPLSPGRPATTLASAGRPGQPVDQVSLPAGGALVACAVSAAQPRCRSDATGREGPNALWLVSETGVGYPIADQETAAALGVRSAVPVPVDALRALVAGPALDAAQARRGVDVLTTG